MKTILSIVLLFVLVTAVFAQDDVPPIYREIFNQTTVGALLAVIGAVKLLRNLINVKGFLAVVVTVAASLIYGILQFGIANGATYGLIIGILAALSFYVSKNLGAVLGAIGLGNEPGKQKFVGKVFAFVSSHRSVLDVVVKAVRYIFFRK